MPWKNSLSSLKLRFQRLPKVCIRTQELNMFLATFFFLESKGIISQRTCPYKPPTKWVAKRKNHHLHEVVRPLLLESSIPYDFWVEALSFVVHLINHLPSPALQNQSPYLRLYKFHPAYTCLHTFSCICFIHLPPHERNKLSTQSMKCAFLGHVLRIYRSIYW